MVGAILLPPVDPACAAGVIFFNNVGYLGMCGHGTIGVAVALAHLGRIGPGTHRLETPVGRDRHTRRPQHRDDRQRRELPPGQGRERGGARARDLRGRRRLGRQLVLPGADHGETLSVANVERLTDVTWRIRQALTRARNHGRRTAPRSTISSCSARPRCRAPTARTSCSARARPTIARRAAPAPAPSSPAWSPTASSREGEVWRQESIIGSVFEGSVRIVERPHPASDPRDGVRQRRIHVDRRPRRSLRDGHPAMSDEFERGAEAVVIGGGVIGVACAYFLMRAGWQVTLVERGRDRQRQLARQLRARSARATSCRWPSRAWWPRGSRACLQRNSPFAIKPRLDPALWSWLLHFAARCNERDMIEAGRGIQPLLLSSLALYRDLIEREALDCEFETRGLLVRLPIEAGDGVLRRDRPVDDRGISLPGPAIRRRRPDRARAGASARPGRRLVLSRRCPPAARQADAGLAARSRSRRATIRENCAFEGFRSANGRAPWPRSRPRASWPPTCSSSPPAPGRRS